MDTFAERATKTFADAGRIIPDPAKVEALRRLCAAELLAAFGLGGVKFGGRVLGSMASLAANRLAREAAIYDEIVGEYGLGVGGSWAVERMAREVEFAGTERVPRTGPLLIVSNHPGLSDTLALFAATPRDDLRVVAAKRPLLDALPNTSRHLMTVDEASRRRFGLIKTATKHMKRGGAVLTFPGGKIEPDPAVLPGAAEALDRWSMGSVDLFARLVPELAVVPVIVGDVLSPRALANPLTFLRRREEDRRWLAASLQMLAPKVHGTSVRVEFGSVIRASEGDEKVSDTVLEEARRLVRSVRDRAE